MATDFGYREPELYVHRLDELREEIGRAMAAISGNKLAALEESLWRQEVLCTGLKHICCTAEQAQPGPALAKELRKSLCALHNANRSYVELLRQAQVSNHLLYALCAAHAATLNPPNVAPRCSLEA